MFSLAALADFTWYKSGPRQIAQKSLLLLAVLIFSTKRAIIFFVLFELSLVPIAYLILAKGDRPERVAAVFYLAVYTVAGGAFHFLAVVLFEATAGRVSFTLRFGLAGGIA